MERVSRMGMEPGDGASKAARLSVEVAPCVYLDYYEQARGPVSTPPAAWPAYPPIHHGIAAIQDGRSALQSSRPA